MSRRAAIPAGLFALAWIVYAPTLDFGYVDFDDRPFVEFDPLVTSPLSGEATVRIFSEPFKGNWLPLSRLSLQVDHSVGGLEPRAYHRTNVLLHAANSALLFLALDALTLAAGPSALAAALFAVHPLHVESVAWIAERKDVLSGLFWMATLLAYAHYARSPSPLRLSGVVLCLALGLLSKSTLVTLPFVLLLLDFWPLRRIDPRAPDPEQLRALAAEKLPLFAVVALASLATYFVQDAGDNTAFGARLDAGERVANALWSYLSYVRSALWPSGLAFYYPHPFEFRDLRAGDALSAAVAAALLAGISLGALRLRASRPWLPVGWLWFLGTLVPMIGLIQVGGQARADRYTYLPAIGLWIAAAWSADELARRSAHWRRAVLGVGLIAITALVVAARGQAEHWRNPRTLFERAVSVTQGNRLAHELLGGHHKNAGRLELAAQHYRAAAEISPLQVTLHFDLALIEETLGNDGAAIAAYRRGLAVDPDDARARALLGLALVREGHVEEGSAQVVDAYRRALARREQALAASIRAGAAEAGLEAALDAP